MSLVVAVFLGPGCEARLELGGGCTRSSECPAPLVCAVGRCRTECLEHADCSFGGRCVRDPASGEGRCSLPDDPDCRTAGSECAASLLCVAGDCVNSCDTARACPPGSACVLDPERRAYCERDDVDAGAPFDGGALDGGLADASDPTDAESADADVDAGCARLGCGVLGVAITPSATCAIAADGSVWCWGHGRSLSLEVPPADCGSAGPSCSPTPVRARVEHGGTTRDFVGVTSISGGRVFSAIEAGRAFSWISGFRSLGAAGAGEIARAVRTEPGTAFLPASVVEVRHGVTTALAVTATGGVFMWGDDDYAQWGDGGGSGTDFALAADPLPGGSSRRLGGWHGCGIRAGVVECWGENDVGQAGGSVTGAGAFVGTATPVAGVPSGVTRVAAGRSQSCALGSGSTWCWGTRTALGNAGEPPGCVDVPGGRACPPVEVAWAGAPFVELFGGPFSEDTCATTAAGELWCWGPVSGVEPTRRDLPLPVTDVALGDLHACAIAAGEVWCWGANTFGQLGRGFIDEAMLPPGRVVWPE